jgi:menaquinone-dependent protoporphyrinogen oxidase
MASVLIVYGTTDGHTAQVADRLARELRAAGHEVTVHDAAALDLADSPAGFDAILVGGSVHLGKHQPALEEFVRAHRDELAAKPSALFSVSMAAAAGPSGRESANRYVAQLTEKTGWQPRQTATLAGALLYTRYGFLKRLFMKWINRRAGHDTDTSRDFVYTDWNAVDELAHQFARRLAAGPRVVQPDAGLPQPGEPAGTLGADARRPPPTTG